MNFLEWLDRYVEVDKLNLRPAQMIPQLRWWEWAWYVAVVIASVLAFDWADDWLSAQLSTVPVLHYAPWLIKWPLLGVLVHPGHALPDASAGGAAAGAGRGLVGGGFMAGGVAGGACAARQRLKNAAWTRLQHGLTVMVLARSKKSVYQDPRTYEGDDYGYWCS